eukprot:scaffold4354_cov285-Alexandrium_tamarense.AAC.10
MERRRVCVECVSSEYRLDEESSPRSVSLLRRTCVDLQLGRCTSVGRSSSVYVDANGQILDGRTKR